MRNPTVHAIRAIKSECSEKAKVHFDYRSKVLVVEPQSEEWYEEDKVFNGQIVFGIPVRVVRPTQTTSASPSLR